MYARDTSAPDKHRRARAWIEHLWSSGDGRISTQVLSEYYVTVTRKLKPGLSKADARADVNDLTAWAPQPIDTALVDHAFKLEDEARLSYWDALIVAAAVRAGCTYLLSEDLNDGQAIDHVSVVNPFKTSPTDISLGTVTNRPAGAGPTERLGAASDMPQTACRARAQAVVDAYDGDLSAARRRGEAMTLDDLAAYALETLASRL